MRIIDFTSRSSWSAHKGTARTNSSSICRAAPIAAREFGETVTEIARVDDALTAIATLAVLVVSATEVAVMVAVKAVATDDGAV